jgi:predicted tellurium resistance membrane protein TerC
MLIKVMERWPVIITIGAALLGFVAGEMAITDPAIGGWVKATFTHVNDKPVIAGGVSLEIVCGLVGAAFVVIVGRWLAKRKEATTAAAGPHEAPVPDSAQER